MPAGSVLGMTVPPVGVRSCVNPAPFLGGVDVEEDEALRQRVLETYRRMPNGANAAFYEQGALSFPLLGEDQLVEPGHQHILAQPLPGEVVPQGLLHPGFYPGGPRPLLCLDAQRGQRRLL